MLPLRTFSLAAVICTVHLFDAETLRQLCLFVVLRSISWVHRPELECVGGEFLGRRMCALLVCTGECVESVWRVCGASCSVWRETAPHLPPPQQQPRGPVRLRGLKIALKQPPPASPSLAQGFLKPPATRPQLACSCLKSPPWWVP